MPVSKRIRYEILRRDNNTCRYCHATDSPLTVDHVIPVSLGGSDDPSNLVAACKDCNAGKTSSSPDAPLVAEVADDAARWSAAIQQAAAASVAEFKASEKLVRAFDKAWGEEAPSFATRPAGWQDSIRTWIDMGLPVELLTASAHIALRNTLVRQGDKWKYFCGIVWKKHRELQEAARKSLGLTEQPPAVCGHCEACVQAKREPEFYDPTEPWCEALTPRLHDEDQHDACPYCGEMNCVPRYAREGGMREGSDYADQMNYNRWRNSFTRLQQVALIQVTSPSVFPGRLI